MTDIEKKRNIQKFIDKYDNLCDEMLAKIGEYADFLDSKADEITVQDSYNARTLISRADGFPEFMIYMKSYIRDFGIDDGIRELADKTVKEQNRNLELIECIINHYKTDEEE